MLFSRHEYSIKTDGTRTQVTTRASSTTQVTEQIIKLRNNMIMEITTSSRNTQYRFRVLNNCMPATKHRREHGIRLTLSKCIDSCCILLAPCQFAQMFVSSKHKEATNLRSHLT